MTSNRPLPVLNLSTAITTSHPSSRRLATSARPQLRVPSHEQLRALRGPVAGAA